LVELKELYDAEQLLSAELGEKLEKTQVLFYSHHTVLQSLSRYTTTTTKPFIVLVDILHLLFQPYPLIAERPGGHQKCIA
jgi:hypothetical protein